MFALIPAKPTLTATLTNTVTVRPAAVPSANLKPAPLRLLYPRLPLHLPQPVVALACPEFPVLTKACVMPPGPVPATNTAVKPARPPVLHPHPPLHLLLPRLPAAISGNLAVAVVPAAPAFTAVILTAAPV